MSKTNHIPDTSKTIQPSKDGGVLPQAAGSPHWVVSLDKHRASMLPGCTICGTDPDEVTPRIHEEKAMGSTWRHHLICWVCGGSHAATTIQETVDRWNAEKLPNYHFNLPKDISDAEENDQGDASQSD